MEIEHHWATPEIAALIQRDADDALRDKVYWINDAEGADAIYVICGELLARYGETFADAFFEAMKTLELAY